MSQLKQSKRDKALANLKASRARRNSQRINESENNDEKPLNQPNTTGNAEEKENETDINTSSNDNEVINKEQETIPEKDNETDDQGERIEQ